MVLQELHCLPRRRAPKKPKKKLEKWLNQFLMCWWGPLDLRGLALGFLWPCRFSAWRALLFVASRFALDRSPVVTIALWPPHYLRETQAGQPEGHRRAAYSS